MYGISYTEPNFLGTGHSLLQAMGHPRPVGLTGRLVEQTFGSADDAQYIQFQYIQEELTEPLPSKYKKTKQSPYDSFSSRNYNLMLAYLYSAKQTPKYIEMSPPSQSIDHIGLIIGKVKQGSQTPMAHTNSK